jgi:hypothetical protein
MPRPRRRKEGNAGFQPNDAGYAPELGYQSQHIVFVEFHRAQR